ncbi:MAG TPA: WD40 repeat domain-containing protein [Gemmataceae bacterium]|jgi:WD40 repeat protein
MANRYVPLVLLSVAGLLGAEPQRDRFGDPLPEGAIARLGSLRLRHEHPLLAAASAPDGKILATAGMDRQIFCWDPVTGKEVRRVPINFPGRMWGLRFSGDGKSLIVAGDNGAFRVVDAVTGAEQRKLDPPEHGIIYALDVSRDGKTAVTIQDPGNLAVWDLAAGERLHEFKGLTGVRQSRNDLMALTPDGKQLVRPQADGSLHLMDVASGKKVLAFEMPPKQPGMLANRPSQKIAITPDGRYLAYGNSENAAVLCDLKTGKRVRELASLPSGLTTLAFTPDSRFLVVGGHTSLRVFGVISGKEIRNISKPPGVYTALLFSCDGRTMAAFGLESNTAFGHTIDLWDVAAGRQRLPPVGHQSPLYSLVFFPDGKRLASVASGGELLMWDIAAGRVLAHRSALSLRVGSIGVAGDGETLQFLGTDGAVHHWDPLGGREERQQMLFRSAVNQLTLSPDARSVAATTFQPAPQLLLWNLKADKAARQLDLPNKVEINQFQFSLGSRRLAAVCSDGAVRLWDRSSGGLVKEMKGEVSRRDHTLSLIALAGDGRSVALFDGQVHIREIASGGERLQISCSGAVAYSPDSRFLACGQEDGGIIVFGTATGKPLARWQGRQGLVHVLAFNHDSHLMASGGHNGTILVWKLPDGEGLPATLKTEEAMALWQALADSDAARANRALAGLAAAPAQALPLVKQRFRTDWKKPDAKQMARLIAALDDNAFKVRERATRELSEAGPDAADALRLALANNPSTEAKRRLEDLLNRLSKGGNPERLRSLRAIEVLERIGTPESIEVLRELGRQSLPVELHEDIEASLQRLEKHRPAAATKLSTP